MNRIFNWAYAGTGWGSTVDERLPKGAPRMAQDRAKDVISSSGTDLIPFGEDDDAIALQEL